MHIDYASKGAIMEGLDSKINEAINKHKVFKTGFITLIEKEFNIGFNVDKTLCILLDSKGIGNCAISEIDEKDGIYLEWIEFSDDYKGKYLLRPALLAIGDYFDVKYFILDCLYAISSSVLGLKYSSSVLIILRFFSRKFIIFSTLLRLTSLRADQI